MRAINTVTELNSTAPEFNYEVVLCRATRKFYVAPDGSQTVWNQIDTSANSRQRFPA